MPGGTALGVRPRVLEPSPACPRRRACDPEAGGAELAVDLLAAGGLLVADDFTPGRHGPDPAREFLFGHPQLVASEVQVMPEMAVILAARV